MKEKSWQGAMLLAGLEGEKVEAAKQLGSHLALALRLDFIVRLKLRLRLRKTQDQFFSFSKIFGVLQLTQTF